MTKTWMVLQKNIFRNRKEKKKLRKGRADLLKNNNNNNK